MIQKVCLCRIAYRRWERCEVGTWLAHCALEAAARQVKVNLAIVDQNAVEPARNTAVQIARRAGADALVMVDDDMAPHPAFFPTALEAFRVGHEGQPVLAVGSPACSAERLVNVARNEGGVLVRPSRHETAGLAGLERVWCVGTGLIAIHMDAFALLGPPYFRIEYADAECTTAGATEDIAFSRNLSEAGGCVLCAWDCWSGHAKEELIGKPEAEAEPEASPLKVEGQP